ncbi:MAG: EAL domain-containing protein [Nitrosomonas sp.]|nr:EAL domain-containing protein [Nitrosomonas sp.]MDP1950356.1 EAL domain-containing protein [Nitrosomonas sp.]
MMQESVKNTAKHYLPPGYGERRFLSLKWKISLLSSLILLAVVLLFCTVSYLGLMANFESQRDSEYQRYAREVDTLIKNSAKDLRRMAEMIPFLDDMGEVLLEGDTEKINSIFNRHWSLLQFHSGVEFVRFYNNTSHLIANWDISEPNEHKNETLLSWVQNVNLKEQPVSPLLCRKSCTQFIVAPLLVGGKNSGVVVIGISLADAFLGFKSVSGADVGLFISEPDGGASRQDEALIAEWGVRITALTNKEKNLEIIQQAIQVYPEFGSLVNGIQLNWNDHYQQIKLFPLIGTVASGKVYFVVINDVTHAVNNIYESIWKIALIGLLGLMVSELLLYVIFTRLLSRLKDVAFSLPLLASNNYDNFRSSLFSTKSKQKFKDEIDVVYEAATTLSYQLEMLKDKVSYRTKILIKQRDELSKERDFVANLLDTAQVIVLTQNASGEINTLNAYGEMLTRYKEVELQGSSFLKMLAPDDRLSDLPVCFEEIHLGQREQFRHEAITNCKDGSTRHVAWLHSRLAWFTEDDPAILSVGLDVTEYKRVEGHLAWLADHDPLTNLFNRRRFGEELEQVLSRAERYRHSGALLFFDLDRFKYINDTSGHQAGDAFLKVVADLLSQTIRADDITGRLGGDEFAVILPETGVSGAIETAKKILAYLNETQLTINNRTHKISASIGIAIFPEHGNNVHDLLAAADLAMYQAKDTGRNTWHLFSNNDNSRERMHTLVYWKETIEYAHLHDNFLLYLQPIIDVKSKKIDYYEVLLRMRDKDGTILLPTGFISAAEQTGLIHAIDHLVLRKAIALAAKINRSESHVAFSINLSAHAFNDPELLPIIERELASHGLDPRLIMFEITETAALENLPGARNLMIEIKELGCGFVLDDFGVGFSSFYYLRELPVDTVKLDGSFIRNLAHSTDDQILVKALCSVARGFGKKITAEFVENEEIFLLIEKMDIDFAQGYFVGKPAAYIELFPQYKKAVGDSR